MATGVQDLHASLQRLALPIATAESCTSGLLASTLTSVPNASSVFRGGVVAYSGLFKERLLGVPAAILDVSTGGPGEVSRQCALAMAQGVLKASGVIEASTEDGHDTALPRGLGHGIGVSTTGYLDSVPDWEKASRAGEVWIGVHWVLHGKEGSHAEEMRFRALEEELTVVATREVIREERKKQVAERAVALVLEILVGVEGHGPVLSG